MDLGIIISDESLIIAIIIAMSLALAGVLVASKRRTGLVFTPVTCFLLFAFVHVLFGRYEAASVTDKYSFVGPATLAPFVDKSFLIISTGLSCCLLGYLLFPCASSGRIAPALIRMSSRHAFDQICARSRVIILLAIPLIVIGLQSLGGIPLLSDNPRHDRYLMNFTDEHRMDNFLVNRGREAVVFPAAALALSWYLRKRRVVDALLAVLALGSSLLTATRSPLLISASTVMVVLIWKGRFKVVFLTLAAVLGGLVLSEIALGTDSNTGASDWSTIERLGADVAEVRDLGWTLVKHDGNYWGLTFLAGLLPIPAFASDFTQTYHLRTVTLNAIGIPLSAAHGGLRITFSGECYLNFGWSGVVIGGLFYGWACARFSALFHRLRAASEGYPVGAYILSCAWVAASFMIYMSSSASGGTLKTYAGVLLLLTFRLQRTSLRASDYVPHPNGPIEWTHNILSTRGL
jgi:oligosaccharide repeat unit polymerase